MVFLGDLKPNVSSIEVFVSIAINFLTYKSDW